MKFKNLGFSSKEGLSLANFQDFYSRDWGEGGGYTVDILLNGQKVAMAYEEGNGGELDVDYVENAPIEDFKNAVLTFLKRVDASYGPNTKFSWHKDQTKVGNMDISSAIENLLDLKEMRKNKQLMDFFAKGAKLVASIESQDEIKAWVSGSFNDDKDVFENHLVSKYGNDKTIWIFSQSDLRAKTM